MSGDDIKSLKGQRTKSRPFVRLPGHSTLGECREPSRPEAQHLAVADEEARHRVTDLITDRKRLGKVEAAGVEPASFGREMCPLR